MSEYSVKVDRKLTEMEDRLNKVNRKKSHRSGEKHSRRSKTKKNSEDHITIQVNSVNTGLYNPTNSFTQGVNQVSTRAHKSSFGDYSTSSRLNESSSSSLTKRISEALEKTQDVFKNYEKFTRRKSRLL